MSNNFRYGIIIFVFFTFLVHFSQSQVVCSEDELVREILEDIFDNGKLDCLRKSVAPDLKMETEEEKRKRIDAEWDSDCSFEADDSWVKSFISNYQLDKGLVDVNGVKVDYDFEDQADMCEIIRALVANGRFPEIGEDVTNIDPRIVDYIDCPGNDGQTGVCAATEGSFADRKKWYILVDGLTITVAGEPKYFNTELAK